LLLTLDGGHWDEQLASEANGFGQQGLLSAVSKDGEFTHHDEMIPLTRRATACDMGW